MVLCFEFLARQVLNLFKLLYTHFSYGFSNPVIIIISNMEQLAVDHAKIGKKLFMQEQIMGSCTLLMLPMVMSYGDISLLTF